MPIDLKRLSENALSLVIPEKSIELDGQAVTSLIADLSRARAKMKPEVPSSWAGGQAVEVILKPKVTLESEKLASFVLMHVRDPGIGWMHYAFSRNEAVELAAILQKFASTLPVPPMPGEAN